MNKKESTKSASTGSEKITSTEVSSDLIVIGKDIVTEVIVNLILLEIPGKWKK